MAKLALQADVCYNRPINIVVPERCWSHPQAWIHSLEECIMDILRSNSPQGKLPSRFMMSDKYLARFVENITLVDCGYSSQCWQWNKYVSPKGYSLMRIGEGRKIQGHRLAYEHFIGAIPDGYEIDHLCKNPSCANPDHLEAVVHAENVRRSEGTKGLSFQHKACRMKRHPLTEDNILIIAGRRICKICYEAAKPRRAAQQRTRRHRFTASLMASRKDVICIVVEEPAI